jgi:NADH dehydrogenase
MKMPGINRKVRISLGWLIRLLFPPDFAQARVSVHSGIQHQHFEPGEYVFSQGDLGDKVYIIEKGECEVIREDESGPHSLAILKAGECFGEMAVMGDSLRMASIRARTPLDVVIIEKTDFQQIARSVPEFSNAFEKVAAGRQTPAHNNPSPEQE